MPNPELLKKLELMECKIHHRKAIVELVNDHIRFAEVCCEVFTNELKALIDEDLHQRYMEDLDDLFS